MKLEPTGERVIEEFYLSSPSNYLIYLFHKVTYNFATEFVTGRQVLDYGCGSGYGTHQIASKCEHITGVDISPEAIEYARGHYHAPNLTYTSIETAERAPLPYPESHFDTVLSFQVIEHIRNPASYLSEIRRVLKPGGTFVCATPDRTTRLLTRQKPWNMWHVHEYDAADLKRTLSDYFQVNSILHMGGKKEVLDIEIRRTRRLAWLMLPVTLPFIPEPVRLAVLKAIKRATGQTKRKTAQPGQNFPFDESDLTIAPGAAPSVNLIAVSKKL